MVTFPCFFHWMKQKRKKDIEKNGEFGRKMKTELKSAFFYYNQHLCDFVNRKQITKENIQSIIENEGYYILFYWEITE